jgi:hypothetical protein
VDSNRLNFPAITIRHEFFPPDADCKTYRKHFGLKSLLLVCLKGWPQYEPLMPKMFKHQPRSVEEISKPILA